MMETAAKQDERAAKQEERATIQAEQTNKHFEEAAKRAAKPEEQTKQISNSLATLGTKIIDMEANGNKTSTALARPPDDDAESPHKKGKIES